MNEAEKQQAVLAFLEGDVEDPAWHVAERLRLHGVWPDATTEEVEAVLEALVEEAHVARVRAPRHVLTEEGLEAADSQRTTVEHVTQYARSRYR